MDHRPVLRIAKDGGTVSQLDGDHPGCGARADPRQQTVAVGVVRNQQRPDPGREPHVLVGFVQRLERLKRRSNRALLFRDDEDPLVSLVAG